MISNDFYSGGLEAAMLAGCRLSRKLITTLQMNSLPSDQLMLFYYKSLLNSSVCMLCCLPDCTLLLSLHVINFEYIKMCKYHRTKLLLSYPCFLG